ncbi:MAG: DUF1592 domain-containing protein [Lentisphaeraceae bacterium]|nr:DUF1592 domain-containing protein [Lentisphaeraceae bacterium]
MSTEVTSPAVKIFCPSCEAKLDVTGHKSLSKVNCPQCSTEITVPETASPNVIKKTPKPAPKTKKPSLKVGDVKKVRRSRKKSSSSSMPIFVMMLIIIGAGVFYFKNKSGMRPVVAEVSTEEEKTSNDQDRISKQELARQEELTKQEELDRQKELAKQEMLAKQEALAKQKELEQQQEIDAFLALLNPSEEQKSKFKELPSITSANFQSLMNRHCNDCHNSKKRKGDLALDIFTSKSSVYRYYEIVKHAYESVKVGDMPPEDEDISDKEREQLLTYLEKAIFTLESEPADFKKTAIVRRLTPYEYDNTVEALTGLKLGLGEGFPGDGGGNQGFANDASLMSISPLLMEKYVSAAEAISAYSQFEVEEGFTFSQQEVTLPPPGIFEKELQTKLFSFLPAYYPRGSSLERQLPRLMTAVAQMTLNTSNKEPVESVANQSKVKPEFLRNAIKYFSSSGGKTSVELNAIKPWRALRKGKIDEDKLNDAIKHFVGAFKAAELSILNRQGRDRAKHVSLVKSVERFFQLDTKTVATLLSAEKLQEYQRLKDIYSFTRYASSMRESTRALVQFKPIVRKFLYKLHRRPPSESDLSLRTKDYLEDILKYGLPFASRIMVISEFASFNFIFRIEHKRDSSVDDYDLASRLSYFLWAGPPDDELLDLASRGELKQEEVLLKQVSRMLANKRSAKLAKHFADQWLHFGEILNTNGPSEEVFEGFDESLAKDMWQETALCFNYIVKNDRSVLELLSSDYSFVNHRLAKIYGIDQSSTSFKKVYFQDGRRGGLLGHAGFLTMTSLPQRTSPIVRGNWIITNLLGTPTPPAPDNVPALPDEEVVSDNFTLTQQLEKHRSNAACNGCHKKIDPLGVVLENYDSVGRWRDKYSKGKIESNAEMDGELLKGPEGLKHYLLSNKVQYMRNLSRKLLSYSLGRSLYFYDNYLVNKMIENSMRNNYSFSSLVKAVVSSPQFQHK